jgi:integrase
LGNWLTREQAKDLLAVPDRSTLKGKRDYVILALLVGCALRRHELANLYIEEIQLREDRWVIADLRGKGGRVRTVAVPMWVKQAVNSRINAASLKAGARCGQRTTRDLVAAVNGRYPQVALRKRACIKGALREAGTASGL